MGFPSHELAAEPGSAVDAAATVDACRRLGAGWVVADGYDFAAGYQETLREANLRVLRVDDLGDSDGYPADLVLNQNPSASTAMYSSGRSTGRLLLGTTYALIRSEFLDWIGWRRTVRREVASTLVTFGGNPQTQLLERAANEARIVSEHVTVFPGQISEVDRGRLAQTSGVRVSEPAESIAKAMVESDLAISAAGSTTLELLFLGLPAILVDLVANQTPNAQWLAEEGVAIRVAGLNGLPAGAIADAAVELASDRAKRKRMSAAARDLVDGSGADRVVDEMMSIGPVDQV